MSTLTVSVEAADILFYLNTLKREVTYRSVVTLIDWFARLMHRVDFAGNIRCVE